MLLMIDNYASLTEPDRFPAEPEVTAGTEHTDSTRRGERR